MEAATAAESAAVRGGGSGGVGSSKWLPVVENVFRFDITVEHAPVLQVGDSRRHLIHDVY